MILSIQPRAVITGKEAKYESIADLKDTNIGISRYGRCFEMKNFQIIAAVLIRGSMQWEPNDGVCDGHAAGLAHR